MPKLVARGTDPTFQWQRPLPAEPVTLGRSAAKSDWSVPWDQLISKLHATLSWADGRLSVKREPGAKNAIFVHGEARDQFSVAAGEMFVIGETTFLVQDDEAPGDPGVDMPTPFSELTCSRQELQRHQYTDAHERLDVLAALPAIIRDSPSDADLEARVTDILLRGIPRAEAAAVVRWSAQTASGDTLLEVRHWNRRTHTGKEFRPSRRLVGDAVLRRRQSVMYIWHAGDLRPEFTVTPGLDWSICAPLPDDPEPGWALYISGGLSSVPGLGGDFERDLLLKSDLKFAELVADIFGAFRQVRDLQHRQSRLARFLSRQVLAALSGRDIDEVLSPRETEVTVLFCDLRSSCRLVEEGRHELARLWDRVNEALGIITSGICDQDGVIGDFQGDAAMGFWGWPLQGTDQIERAARAALSIRRRFAHLAEQEGHPLSGLACGIGIANGPAIAGRLGTYDQFKVGVFGPVVNLASRLESMTKQFKTSILVDENVTARLVDPKQSHWVRCRRLAKVRPMGMSLPLVVSELLAPSVELGAISERHRRDSEAALDAFIAGQWDDSRRLLDRLPFDGACAFLKAFMDRHQRTPPPDWDGIIPMDSK